ncbi:MAG: nitroreductase family protein [Acidimicrobiales bacterium]
MAIEIETKDCTALGDAELAELADLCADGPSRFEVGVLSKAAESWVLVTLARENGRLKGFSFSTLERIGGTPSVIVGLASIKRTSKRETVLRAIVHDQLRRAVLAFPDEDVLVGTRFATVSGYEAFRTLQDIVPRPDYMATGEERAWGRRLAKRFGIGSSATTSAASWSAATTPIRGPRPRDAQAREAPPRLRRVLREDRPPARRCPHRLRLGHGRRPREARLTQPANASPSGRGPRRPRAPPAHGARLRRRSRRPGARRPPLRPGPPCPLRRQQPGRRPPGPRRAGGHRPVLVDHAARGASGGVPLAGLLVAPVLVVVATRPGAYVDRYAEADKAATGLGAGADAWPVPYWWVDAGAAVEHLLLGAVEAGLGACLFGIFEHEAAVAEAFAVPADHRLVGTVALGHPAPDEPGRSAGRPRRHLGDVVHRNRW